MPVCVCITIQFYGEWSCIPERGVERIVTCPHKLAQTVPLGSRSRCGNEVSDKHGSYSSCHAMQTQRRPGESKADRSLGSADEKFKRLKTTDHSSGRPQVSELCSLASPWHNHNGWRRKTSGCLHTAVWQAGTCLWAILGDEGGAYAQKSLRCRLLGDAACALLTALRCYSNWTLIVLGLFSGLLDFARFIQMCCLLQVA